MIRIFCPYSAPKPRSANLRLRASICLLALLMAASGAHVSELAPRRRNAAPALPPTPTLLQITDCVNRNTSLVRSDWATGSLAVPGRTVDPGQFGAGAALAIPPAGNHCHHGPRSRSRQQRRVVLALGKTPAAARALFLPPRPILRQFGPNDLAGSSRSGSSKRWGWCASTRATSLKGRCPSGRIGLRFVRFAMVRQATSQKQRSSTPEAAP